MKDSELQKLIANMSLEDKALELTQYPADKFLSVKDTVITGTCNLATIDKDKLWSTGSALNAPNGETVRTIRNKRAECGITSPFMFMLDVIHGYKTLYPVPLAMSCSFDTQLIEDCAFLAATEAKYDGVDVAFSPMVDLARDARWGRVAECGGEDPYLSGEIGKAVIRGYHKGGIACCVKHFAGYGAAEAGREYNTTDISERSLKEYYLKPYRACMDEQPEMVMSSFNLLNGKPILGHKEIMVDMLRREWGFDGVVISDYDAVEEMSVHGYLSSGKECAMVAAESELDIEMCSPLYANHLTWLVKDGVISEELVDRLVMRVLRLKNKLGMYENPNRYTDKDKFDSVALSEQSRALVRKAAEKTCVLLKNNGVLPLKEKTNISLVGPFADEKEIIGNWYCMGKASDAVSLKEGVEKLLGRAVPTERGCSWKLLESDDSRLGRAVKIAEKSDVIIACVGEHMFNSGEAHSRADIRIPKLQRRLIKRLHKTGKKLVLVVFGGRPLVLSDVEKYADAILYVWQPGTEGGNAIANILYGKAVPSAKTTVSFPRSVGQCPIYYNHFNTGRPRIKDMPSEISGECYRSGYDDEYNSPLYPFGYGLSYTQFEYSDLKLTCKKLVRGKKITASVTVKNMGAFDGAEVVQWYLHDRYASVVRPVKELKGYEKIFLNVGEQKRVKFTIDEDLLKFYTDSGEFAAEDGAFELFVGGNSEDTISATFELVS